MKAALCIGLFLTFPPMMIPGEPPLCAVTNAAAADGSAASCRGLKCKAIRRMSGCTPESSLCSCLVVYEILERSLSKKVGSHTLQPPSPCCLLYR